MTNFAGDLVKQKYLSYSAVSKIKWHKIDKLLNRHTNSKVVKKTLNEHRVSGVSTS